MSTRRHFNFFIVACLFIFFIFFLRVDFAGNNVAKQVKGDVETWVEGLRTPSEPEEKPIPTPKYKPTPTYTPPPVRDPFPLLAMSTPPPIPRWNKPRPNLHEEYDLPIPPPLLIGFTRTWPILLQAVVSYITAGWPPEQIYVIENTGVQMANARGQLSLQNPFYLNHAQLKKLGVNVVQTPVLLNFAQLQNFFLSMANTHEWPYYFWSHQDVLTLSFEEGFEGVTPPYNQPGYKTVYELGCQWLDDARKNDSRWAVRFSHTITWHCRLLMSNLTMIDKHAGTVTDTSAALNDLLALYRDPRVVPDFTDPNPPAPHPEPDTKAKRAPTPEAADSEDPNLAYYHSLRHVSDRMFHYKHGERGRNTWQQGQHGGMGEPFYYSSTGLAEAIDVLTEAGREVFRRKWGHRDCDLISGAGLRPSDAWRVEKDWSD
ncbi:hypothetical protein INS49_004624 [Diaporthe citri]|uniref:uncharacterized protein n=1 Tax=Diaporthe citri TaxID=83186 RepID=UPI001C80DF4F|nr:uncharacterized protein INS49_004624 [Diaporthe citri]KAG6354606.1 hypothetical protein INS49_004624 [Diaporthe citri]